MPKFKSKQEWENEADRLFAEGMSPQDINGKLGTYTGPEGTFTIQQAAKSKRGFTVVDKDKRAKRNAKREEMQRSQSMGVGDTEQPRPTTSTSLRNELGARKGDEIHHRISLIQNTPFFEGLTPEQQAEFVTWANSKGWRLGDQPGNPEIVIPKSDHTSIHAWLRENGIESSKNMERLTERFKGMPMEMRKQAFEMYMSFVQGGADEHMLEAVGDKSVSATHNAAQAANDKKVMDFLTEDLPPKMDMPDVGTIESGPRAGERLPVNERTLRDAQVRQQGERLLEQIQSSTTPPRASPRTLQKGLIKNAKKYGSLGAVVGIINAGQQALAGDLKGAGGTLAQTGLSEVAGDIPVVGDMIEPEGVAAADLSYPARIEAQRQQNEQILNKQEFDRTRPSASSMMSGKTDFTTGTEAFNQSIKQ